MSLSNLVLWAESLTEAEAKTMLLKAAREHTVRFSNPDDIGKEWAKRLKRSGYAALPPYARNYMAHQYLIYCEDSHSRRIPVH